MNYPQLGFEISDEIELREGNIADYMRRDLKRHAEFLSFVGLSEYEYSEQTLPLDPQLEFLVDYYKRRSVALRFADHFAFMWRALVTPSYFVYKTNFTELQTRIQEKIERDLVQHADFLRLLGLDELTYRVRTDCSPTHLWVKAYRAVEAKEDFKRAIKLLTYKMITSLRLPASVFASAESSKTRLDRIGLEILSEDAFNG